MRVLVTGSRNITDEDFVRRSLVKHIWMHIDSYNEVTLVHGDCKGLDRIAASIAQNKFGWLVESYPAKWDKYGSGAGPLRNQQMVNQGADICIAFPLPGSRGTMDCIERVIDAKIRLIIVQDLDDRWKY